MKNFFHLMRRSLIFLISLSPPLPSFRRPQLQLFYAEGEIVSYYTLIELPLLLKGILAIFILPCRCNSSKHPIFKNSWHSFQKAGQLFLILLAWKWLTFGDISLVRATVHHSWKVVSICTIAVFSIIQFEMRLLCTNFLV